MLCFGLILGWLGFLFVGWDSVAFVLLVLFVFCFGLFVYFIDYCGCCGGLLEMLVFSLMLIVI